MSAELLRQQVPGLLDGERLGRVVAHLLGESRSRSQNRIAAGEVTLDGVAASKSTRVVAGQEVLVTAPPQVQIPSPTPVEVVYTDQHIAVINKPAGVVVHDGAGVRGPTLVDSLRAQGVPLAPSEDPRRPGIVHRLDRGTSGLLVVASSPEAMVQLKQVFKAHDVEREYWVLVEGELDPPTATIDAPIVRSASNRTTFTTGDGGREAITHYTTLAFHPTTSEVKVRLESGRTHQVRVHLRAVGRPVAGDAMYGASPDIARTLGLSRQALHAMRLAFDHPVTRQRMNFTQDLPEDLVSAVRLAVG